MSFLLAATAAFWRRGGDRVIADGDPANRSARFVFTDYRNDTGFASKSYVYMLGEYCIHLAVI